MQRAYSSAKPDATSLLFFQMIIMIIFLERESTASHLGQEDDHPIKEQRIAGLHLLGD